MATTKGKPYRFERYRDVKGEWRWRFRAPNGKIVADCAEGDGYKTKRACATGIRLVKKHAPGAPVEDES